MGLLKKAGCLLFLLFSLSAHNAFTQSSSNYTFTTNNNGNFTVNMNGSAINLSFSPNLMFNNQLDYSTDMLPIGFDFFFMGKYYSHFTAGIDGQVGLGTATSTADILTDDGINDLTKEIAYPPAALGSSALLALFWDDLRTSKQGNTIRSVLVGAAPNRCLVIDWNTNINSSSATNNVSGDGQFQLRLYESGEIEYMYGKMQVGPSSGIVSASIGFTAGAADNEFVAISDLSSYAVTTLAANEPATQNLVNSSVAGVITGLHSPVEGSRRYFRFTPPALTGNFSNLSFPQPGAGGMRLAWNDNFSNENGFAIYYSKDNVNFTLAGIAAANATSFDVPGLEVATLYYWRVIAFSEGKKSAAFTGSASTTTCAASGYSGTKKVGPTGDFQSITSALNSLGMTGMSGPVILELQAGYTSSGETFPINIENIVCSDATTGITIRPEAGATNLVIADSSATPVFRMYNASFITIDGRPGGVGIQNELTISNKDSAGSTVGFQRSSHDIELKYLNIRGTTVSDKKGVINMTHYPDAPIYKVNISYCDISGGATPATNLVYGEGVTNPMHHDNSVTHCRLHDYYHPVKNSAAIFMGEKTEKWTITDNDIYQTTERTYPSAVGPYVYGIMAFSTANGSSVIRNNNIGGSAPGLGGPPMTLKGKFVFRGIQATTDFNNTTLIEDNHISNIVLQSGLPQANHAAIGAWVFSGKINSNVIGLDAAGTGISMYDSTASLTKLIGVYVEQTTTIDTTTVSNNIITGLRAEGQVNARTDIYGVYYRVQYKCNIDSNTIGGYAQMLMQNGTRGRTTGIGIISDFSANNTVKVRNNNISYLIGTNNATTAAVAGIWLDGLHGGIFTMTSNHVSHLHAASNSVADGAAAALTGIILNAQNGSTVTAAKNRIYSLASTATDVPVIVTGIYQAASAIAPAVTTISANKISNLSINSINRATLRGINVNNYSGSVDNNMIQLGIDSSGNPISTSCRIQGIYQVAGAFTIWHNSVYIGGENVTDSLNKTYAFTSSAIVSGSSIIHNIFVNQRSNAGAGGHHYCVQLVDADVNAGNNIYIGYNLYYTTKNGGYVGSYNDLEYLSLPLWRTMIGSDNSTHTTPYFKNPTGSALTVDLHVDSVTSIEALGNNGYLIATDFDGESRGALTPVDIGADAGNFIKADVTPPTFIYTPFINTSVFSARAITVNIKDTKPGVDTNLNNKPRIWVRKKFPAVSPWVSTTGQFTSGTLKDGYWKFILDYTALGIIPSIGDSIEYYFVAQDSVSTPNASSSPAAGAYHLVVDKQLLAPTVPLSYAIIQPLPDTVMVGTGQQFTSLTGNNGIFQAIDKLELSHHLTVIIKTDLLEDATHALDSIGLSGYRVKIIPSGDTLKLIRNSATLSKPMIRFNGAKKVTIDGSYNGLGRYLRFVNTNPVPANCTATLGAELLCDSIRYENLIAESNVRGTTFEGKGIFISSTPNNTNIVFRSNLFRDAMAGTGITAGKPLIGIGSTGAGNTFYLTHNEIINFTLAGIYAGFMGDNWRIDSNHFYYTYPGTVQSNQLYSIKINSGSGHSVKANYIGGSAPFCGGGPWHTTSSGDFCGLELGSFYLTVSHNVFTNILIPSNNASSVVGINNNGSYNTITKNIIGDPIVHNSVSSGSSSVQGIHNGSVTGVSITDNIIANLTTTNTTTTTGALGIWSTGSGPGPLVISNNKIYSIICSEATANRGLVKGIVTSGGIDRTIEGNQIHDLIVNNLGANSTVAALDLAGNGQAVAKRNRIYNLVNKSSLSSTIYGILVSPAPWDLINNQVSITNGDNTNNVYIVGIYDVSSIGSGAHTRYYNSVYIGGTSSTNAVSYAYKKEYNLVPVTAFKNNLIYNERSGPGVNLAMSVGQSNPELYWLQGIADYNMFVVPDSTKIAEWGPANYLSMNQWRNATVGDITSFATLPSFAPSASLFINAAEGNLNINYANDICWCLNGKGLPINGVSGDCDTASGVRSEIVSNGATDIGSDEFDTNTLPPGLTVLGNKVPGETQYFIYNQRLIARITWGTDGVLPSLGDVRLHSGSWPNDSTNGGNVANARMMNTWLDIPATGGSGYSYSITFYYDSSMLGKVQDVSQIAFHKRNAGENGSWQILLPTEVDNLVKTITVNGLTSFSEFTGAASNAPLAVPGSSICPGGNTVYKTDITGAGYTYHWQVDTGNGFTDIINSDVYSGITDSVLTITAPPSTNNRYQYRCAVNTGAATINSHVFLLRITSVWTGAVNADWANPLNWSCGQLPDANTDVHIKSGSANYPVINANIICRSIIASPGSEIHVNPGVVIQITGK